MNALVAPASTPPVGPGMTTPDAIAERYARDWRMLAGAAGSVTVKADAANSTVDVMFSDASTAARAQHYLRDAIDGVKLVYRAPEGAPAPKLNLDGREGVRWIGENLPQVYYARYYERGELIHEPVAGFIVTDEHEKQPLRSLLRDYWGEDRVVVTWA